ncbi:MAG: hypothetical protein HYV19_03750 [Gemmatimonadetes bacterium]|nr:hypothetical protein [Gemmatimonadota bacterium]
MTYLDQLATFASARIVAWLGHRVHASRTEWVTAMAAEIETIDDGWKKLEWVVGALPLARSFSRPRLAPATSFTGRMIMDTHEPFAPPRPWYESLILNLTALVAWWLIMSLWVVLRGGLNGSLSGIVTITVMCLLGVVMMLAVRRTGAAYFLAGNVALGVVDLGFRLAYGNGVMQGRAAYFAVMAAGCLGVALSALVERRADAAMEMPLWSAQDVFGSALRSAAVFRRRFGLAAHAVCGLAVFAFTELSIRTIYGLHPFWDPQTNLAILCCAVVGAFLGVLLERTGDRFALQKVWGDHAARTIVSP